jgi:hypothetical protein
MDANELQKMRELYELQIQLFMRQGEEIRGLRIAQDALEKSHELLGKSIELTSKMAGFS